MSTETAASPARAVLEGVPRVGFYQGGPRPPEDDPFPACLRAYLEYRHEDLGRGPGAGHAEVWHAVHVYAMGVSGAAFRMTWDPANWSMGATDLMASSADPLAGVRLAFEAAGYSCEIALKRDYAAAHGYAQEHDFSEQDLRDRIVESIRDRGRPVIAFGVVGPPECCLITGYDQGGDVLIGWSFFQDMPDFNAGLDTEPSGYFRKRGWFADTHGLILIGDSRARPDPRAVGRKALSAALERMRAPAAQGFLQGQAAFTRWADTLLNDALFPADDPPVLQERYGVHHGIAGTLAEARAWGAGFLHQLADDAPEAADELAAAAKCFDAEHDLVWAIWEFTSGDRSGHISSEQGARRLASPVTRGRVVPLIRLIRKEDAEAAQHLENALALLGKDEGGARHTPGRFGRAVLEGVPRIGYDVRLCPFLGALHAALQFRGDPRDYDYLMGVTGAAFRRLYNRDDGGNVDLMYLAPEPHRRAAEALNYELWLVPWDRDRLIQAVKDNIAKGRPVIEFGIIGPPEAGLITGYDQGGDVMIGWSYFQNDPAAAAGVAFEPSGAYRRPDWFARMDRGGPGGFLVLGDRNRWPGPSQRDILISALKWAIDLERTARRPGLPDHVAGLVAYEAWARGLEADADFPRDDPQAMGTRTMIHGDQCVMLEERRSAAGFLRQMAAVAPEAAGFLTAAADLCEQAAGEGGHVWPWGHDMAQSIPGLSDPAIRRELARHVRIAGQVEAKAVDELEKALAILETTGQGL